MLGADLGADLGTWRLAYIYLTSIYVFNIDLGKCAPQANKLSLLRDKFMRDSFYCFIVLSLF